MELENLYKEEKLKKSIDIAAIEEAAATSQLRSSRRAASNRKSADSSSLNSSIKNEELEENDGQELNTTDAVHENDNEETTANSTMPTVSRGKRGRPSLQNKNLAAKNLVTTANKNTLPLKKKSNQQESDENDVVKTTKHYAKDLEIYLEDYFDSICSYQDETQRYLANVFYLLPSAKVTFLFSLFNFITN